MSNQFKNCLKAGKIKEFSRGKALVQKELESANFDFRAAGCSLKEQNYKWATIQTYYAMFHGARALLYSKNYREKSHYCLIEAIRSLYVEKGLFGYWLAEALQQAKILREGADYYSEFSKIGAEKLLEKAEELLGKVKEILEKKKP